MNADYEVFLLHDRPELVNATAELINEEWSRSLAARVASIDGGQDQLPCSVLLVGRVGGGEEGRVVGHARVMPVAGARKAALIETVVVSPKLRGTGLGCCIMEAAERHCFKMGYERMHLSTHDKQGLYSHLGYTGGPQVSPLRKCVAKLDGEQTDAILSGLDGCGTIRDDRLSGSAAIGEDRLSGASHDELQLPSEPLSQATPTIVLAPPPPPPPLPSKLLQAKHIHSEMTVTWMQKTLIVT